MALFGKKKPGETPDNDTPSSANDAAPDASKAHPWFERARTVHEASNYEYAVTCWLQGLRYDPTSVDALESCFKSAGAFLVGQKKLGPSKDQRGSFGGRTPIERFLGAVLESCTNPLDAKLTVRAMAAATKIDQPEAAHWLGERAVALAQRDKKPKKEIFVKIVDVARKVGAFDLATKAGEIAVQIDPSDSALEDKVRHLSAEAAIARGGFEDAGKEGGFRKRIRNSDKQRMLDEESSIVRSEDTAARVIDNARKDYDSRPEDPNSVVAYVRALRARGSEEDENTAIDVLMLAFDTTMQFRFREEAGQLRIRKARRALRLLEKKVEAGDDAAKEALHDARKSLLTLELGEHKLRMKEYPTDLSVKYEAARRMVGLGMAEEAIPLLQQAQDDAKLRIKAMSLLGDCFAKCGFDEEAIDTYHAALGKLDDNAGDIAVTLRYGLLTALHSKADRTRDADIAAEALKLASAIMLKEFNYRDIRQRRETLQKLVKDLRASAAQ